MLSLAARVLAVSPFALILALAGRDARAQGEPVQDPVPGPAPSAAPAAPALPPLPDACAAASVPTAPTVPAGSAAVASNASDPVPPETYWYGWQTLAVDGASVVTTLASAAAGSAPLAVVGLGGLVLGGPIVHVANGRPLAALGSLVLRTALPAVGAYLGYSAAGSCYEDPKSNSFLGDCFLHGFAEASLGLLLGLGGAVAIDAAALAHGERESRPVENKETGMPRITSVAPRLDTRTNTASVGIGGTF